MFVNGVDLGTKGADLAKVRLAKPSGLVFQYPEYQLFEETVAKDIAFGPRKPEAAPRRRSPARVRTGDGRRSGLAESLCGAFALRSVRRTEAPRSDCGRFGNGAEYSDSRRACGGT